jgi:hypothetical protein
MITHLFNFPDQGHNKIIWSYRVFGIMHFLIQGNQSCVVASWSICLQVKMEKGLNIYSTLPIQPFSFFHY